MEVEIMESTTTKTVKHITKTSSKMEISSQEMSKNKMFGGNKDLDAYDDVDIDELLDQLSPEELNMLAEDVDPDDPCVPPSERCAYKCIKEATGPLDRKKLINHINEQAINEPDQPEMVPYVHGTVRGKKWVPPPPPEIQDDDDDVGTVEVDLDDEFAAVLDTATEDEIVDLAAILGFHSMMNQDQYHASLLNKGKPLGVGWGGITKATKFKPLPQEPPNDTDTEESIKRLQNNDDKCKELNFNNIRNISDEQFNRLFSSLENNTKLEYLSLANTGISDRLLDVLCSVLLENKSLKTLNLETNNITPAGIVRVLEAINKLHSIEEIRMANQRQGILGNKIEMNLTNLIEANPTILRLGVHFEFNDSRNRVSRHLQKNLDTFRVDVPLKSKPSMTKSSTEAASLSFTLQQSNPSGLMDLDESDSDDSDDSIKRAPPQPQQPINQDHLAEDDDSLSSSSIDSPRGESGRRFEDDTDDED